MEQSPSWDADSFSASEEIVRIARNPDNSVAVIPILPHESNPRGPTLFL
jgi:hypothetical protein